MIRYLCLTHLYYLYNSVFLSQRVFVQIPVTTSRGSCRATGFGCPSYVNGVGGTTGCFQQSATTVSVLYSYRKHILTVFQRCRQQDNESRRLVQYNHVVVYFCHGTRSGGSERDTYRRVITCHREILAEEREVAASRGAEVRRARCSILPAADVEFCGAFAQHVHTCILNSLAQRFALGEDT